MAVSELAPQPVAFHAAVFFRVNATYICLIWELIDRTYLKPEPRGISLSAEGYRMPRMPKRVSVAS
jgi:hypothetical protein